jgi:hypothetical protein
MSTKITIKFVPTKLFYHKMIDSAVIDYKYAVKWSKRWIVFPFNYEYIDI